MSIAELRDRIAPVRSALLAHPLYAEMQELAALRVFMEYHVFAVWDFMSLLKALQQRLTCVTTPWTPRQPLPLAARLVNEIVLAEETDDDGAGGYASHFTLYQRAMRSAGANTGPIDRLVGRLEAGPSLEAAMAHAELPPAVRLFVAHTFAVVEAGELVSLAATFTFGREDLLPGVFQTIVDELARAPEARLEPFQFYLRRHIDLDGDEHGPMATRLVALLCGENEELWQRAYAAADAALQVRLTLWDAIHAAVRGAALANR